MRAPHRLARGLVFCLLTLSMTPSLASTEEGVPLRRHFTPDEIGGGPQVLAAVQGEQGFLYFTTNRSILEYNGETWRNVRIGPPRRLTRDASGKVWVGCDGDFGYLETHGRDLRFVSLRDTLPEDERPLQRVHGIETVGDSVYVAYSGQIVQWTPTGSTSWRAIPGQDFEALAVHGDQLYVFQRGKGLLRWPQEAEEPIRDIDIDGSVSAVLPLGDGAFLLGTSSGRLYRHTPNRQLTPFAPDAQQRLDGHPVTQLKRIEHRGQQHIAVASRGSGLIQLDPDGSLVLHRDATSGLPSNEVYTLLQDPQGSLWLGTSPGVMRLSAAPIHFYDHTPQHPQSLLRVERYQGDLYSGGVDGLFRLTPSNEAGPAKFHPIDGIETTVTSFAITPKGLIAGTDEGLYQVQEDAAVQLTKEGDTVTWAEDPGVLLVTSNDLLRVMVDEPQGWRSIDHPGLIANLVFEIIPGDHNDFWLFTRGARILYRLTFPNGFEASPQLDALETLAPWPRPIRVEGRLGIRDGLQVFFWHEDAQRLQADERFSLAEWIPEGKDRYELRATAGGDIWLTFRDRAVRIDKTPEGDFAPGPSISFASRLNFDTHPDPGEEHVLWLATDRGPARFDTRMPPSHEVPLQIAFFPPGAREKQMPSAASPLILPHSAEAARFEVATPYYLAESLTEYRYRLHGLNELWSAWTEEPTKEFTNLPGRAFRFEVQARNGGRLLGTSSLAFRVLPPWHQTWWFRGALLIALASLAWLYAQHLRRRVEHQRAIAERERAMSQRLQEIDRLKDEFLAKTSHELRTPLYGITGLAESMLSGASGELTDTAQSNLAMIMASGQRLSHLVNDILDFSKLRHHSLRLQRGPVDLHAVAEVILTLSKPLVGQKDLRLTNAVPVDLPLADADENRLQQILYNLVGNAIRFTESGFVEISAAASSDRLQIQVADSGIGIDPQDQERIFEAFEQAEDTLERQHGGTGLGLPVTRQLVELHGGSLLLESSPGAGSTFTFDLPRSTASDPATESQLSAAPIARLLEERPTAPPTPLENPSSDGPRVLVVDDEPVNLQVIRNFLTVESFQLTLAASGKEALELLESESFDLVLLDVMMPGLSGYEVIRTLRQSHRLAELPVIFLTARSQDADVVTGMSLGANDYLTKPISKDRLLARIKPHLELLESHRHLEDRVQEKLEEIRVLEGILPICAGCKKIRDSAGIWEEMEIYISKRSEATFSHGLCPTCIEQLYPN